MNYPNLSMMVRIRSFAQFPDEAINIFDLARGNFFLLFAKSKFTSTVCICFDCGICVHNMENVDNALLIHSIIMPTCPFVLRNVCENLIDYNNCENLLKRHLYF